MSAVLTLPPAYVIESYQPQGCDAVFYWKTTFAGLLGPSRESREAAIRCAMENFSRTTGCAPGYIPVMLAKTVQRSAELLAETQSVLALHRAWEAVKDSEKILSTKLVETAAHGDGAAEI